MKDFTWLGLLLSVFLILFLSACEQGRKDIRDYYYPLKELEDGLVYEYRSADGVQGPVYWYHRSIIQDTAVYLSSTYYRYALLPLQHVRERMTNSGMVMEGMTLYEQDSTNNFEQVQARVEVKADDVFPFSVQKEEGGIYLNHVQWQPPLDTGATITVIKNRYYAGDTSVQYKGKNYKAIILRVKQLMEYDQNGVNEQQFSSEEIYAKGLGLVAWRRSIPPDVESVYLLHDRYSMQQLEDSFRVRYTTPARPGELLRKLDD